MGFVLTQGDQNSLLLSALVKTFRSDQVYFRTDQVYSLVNLLINNSFIQSFVYSVSLSFSQSVICVCEAIEPLKWSVLWQLSNLQFYVRSLALVRKFK